MNITEKNIIGELVAADYRTAEVFTRYGIDFCCKGAQSIGEACARRNIGTAELLGELNDVGHRLDRAITDYKAWPADLLADYIEKKHHRYVNESIPVIRELLARVCTVHGKAHPELLLIAEEFYGCSRSLVEHMQGEENVLFPFIRKLFVSEARTADLSGLPMDMIREEHELEGERFERISRLSKGYTLPAGADEHYAEAFRLLRQFEEDLHLHIHLENNILFPKVLSMLAEAANTH